MSYKVALGKLFRKKVNYTTVHPVLYDWVCKKRGTHQNEIYLSWIFFPHPAHSWGGPDVFRGSALTDIVMLLKKKKAFIRFFGAFCCLLPPSDTSVNSNVLDLLRRWETALQRELGISGVAYRVGHIFPPDRHLQILVDLTMTPDTIFLKIFGEKSCFSIYDL